MSVSYQDTGQTVLTESDRDTQTDGYEYKYILRYNWYHILRETTLSKEEVDNLLHETSLSFSFLLLKLFFVTNNFFCRANGTLFWEPIPTNFYVKIFETERKKKQFSDIGIVLLVCRIPEDKSPLNKSERNK